LRIIAGLEAPTEGRVLLDDRDVTAVSPKDRNVAMVFQNYALYPHMSVRKNLSFGLKMRGTPKEEIARSVATVARSLDLEPLLDRYPSQLSGGQRQRVALGRAIIREPVLFLLDEPLSNLDAALRVTMRAELLRLHARLRVTTVYVTHDQVEAMTMGDRLVVLRDGAVQQIGSPEEIYGRPATAFVARFIGSPAMNTFTSLLKLGGGAAALCLGNQRFQVSDGAFRGLDARAEVLVGIRPEALVPTRPEEARLRGEIEIVEVLGKEKILYVRGGWGESLLVVAKPDFPGRVGEPIHLGFRDEDVHLFDVQNERSLRDGPSTV
jgi:ABC-type sugar transport system ATPase subunit